MNCLPTKANLLRKGVILNDDLCPLCNDSPETVSHVFTDCKKAKEVRLVSNVWWKIFAEDANNLDSLITGTGANRKVRLIKDAVLQAYFWFIWKGRNEAVFNDARFNPGVVANNIQSEVFFWVRNRSNFGNNLNWTDWCCNPETM